MVAFVLGKDLYQDDFTLLDFQESLTGKSYSFKPPKSCKGGVVILLYNDAYDFAMNFRGMKDGHEVDFVGSVHLGLNIEVDPDSGFFSVMAKLIFVHLPFVHALMSKFVPGGNCARCRAERLETPCQKGVGICHPCGLYQWYMKPNVNLFW